jgi:predicted metal-dependent hydrolase
MSREAFKNEVARWAKELEVAPKEVRIRAMRRKWASCSSSGRLTFDAGILRQPAEFRVEVVVHELLHLKIPNHGKLFKSLLRAHLGSDPEKLEMHSNVARADAYVRRL